MKKVFTLFLVVLFALPLFLNGQGCMEPASEEGVSVIGFIQPQYELFMDGVDKYDKKADDYNSYSFQRARLGVTGNIPYDINYYVMAEFSSFLQGPYLLDAFITYTRLGPWAKFTIGQFKTPFSLELQTPCHKLHTIYRSLPVRQLVSPFRDIGFMVSGNIKIKKYGSLENHKFFQYQVAALNGSGFNQWDNNQSKDLVFRGILFPWKGIHIGGSYRSGKQLPYSKAKGDGIRETVGGELELDLFNFLIQGEYIYGIGKNLKGIAGAGCGGGGIPDIPGTLHSSGYYAMALYKTPWNLEPVFKYEFYDPDVKETGAYTGTTKDVTTITIGLNYFLNDWTRIQVNYMINDDKNEYGSTDDRLIHNKDGNYFKQQFAIQVQAVLQ